jgi:hypothetical protein
MTIEIHPILCDSKRKLLAIGAASVACIALLTGAKQVETTVESQEFLTLNRKTLRCEVPDLRRTVMDAAHINDCIVRRVFCVARGHQLDKGILKEYPIQNLRTVEDALRLPELAVKDSPSRQLRVIQHDAILQSTIDPWGHITNRFTSEFLHSPLHPGDVVVFAVIND